MVFPGFLLVVNVEESTIYRFPTFDSKIKCFTGIVSL